MKQNANPGCESTKGVFIGKVRANESICREHSRLIIEVRHFPPARPGQFLQILCADPDQPVGTAGVLVRRPFSIGGLERSGDECRLHVLLRTVGRGSRYLADLQPGSRVSVLGPQGRPFGIMQDRPIAYLVGGGVGLPPLIWLAEFLHQAGKQVVAFCGSRSGDLLPLAQRPDVKLNPSEPTLACQEFARFDIPSLVSTDDGSLGARGVIPDHFAAYLNHHSSQNRQACVYSCGPDRMMHAVADICQKRDIPCQVSLERVMACGMGTCQSCVVQIRNASDAEGWTYKLCCTDGPVFDSQEVIWER